MKKILEVRNLVKNYGSRDVIKGVDFEINEKEIITIIGPSGSGKSTFLRCINLLEQPTSGEIIFNNVDVLKGNISKEKYRQKVGMVFQSFNLFENLTVLENCTLGPIKINGESESSAKEKALRFLEKVGMEKYINAKPRHLSGGQKQRVAIARALCMEPEILLFDEPTSSLDPEMVSEVLRTIKELALEGLTMIIVTHEMNFAKDVSTKVIFFDEGRILEQGSANDIFDNAQNERIRDFLSK